MTTRLEQKEKRREEILEAALDTFIRKGYAGTKISDISKKAKMSTGLMFHYFSSKEELYIELIKLGVFAPTQMLTSIPSELDPLMFFQICAEQTLNFAASSSFTAKMFVLMSSAYYMEDIPEQAKELAIGINFYEELAPLIEKGQKNGSIKQGNPKVLSMTFWTALQGVIEVHALNPTFELPKPEWILDIIKN